MIRHCKLRHYKIWHYNMHYTYTVQNTTIRHKTKYGIHDTRYTTLQYALQNTTHYKTTLKIRHITTRHYIIRQYDTTRGTLPNLVKHNKIQHDRYTLHTTKYDTTKHLLTYNAKIRHITKYGNTQYATLHNMTHYLIWYLRYTLHSTYTITHNEIQQYKYNTQYNTTKRH